MFSSKTLALVALAPYVYAQDIGSVLGSLSDSCRQATTGVIAGDFSQCANLGGLPPIVTAEGSIVQPVDDWIDGLCTAEPCTQEQVDNATQTLQSACQEDTQNDGKLAKGIIFAVEHYQDLRDTFCLQSTENQTYCVTDVLTAVEESSGGNLTIQNITETAQSGDAAQALASIPPETYCTDCGKALYNNLEQIAGNLTEESQGGKSSASAQAANVLVGRDGGEGTDSASASSTEGATPTSTSTGAAASLSSAAESACGTAFVDGETPTGVTVASPSASATESATDSETSSEETPAST